MAISSRRSSDEASARCRQYVNEMPPTGLFILNGDGNDSRYCKLTKFNVWPSSCEVLTGDEVARTMPFEQQIVSGATHPPLETAVVASGVMGNFIAGKWRKVGSALANRDRLDPLYMFYCGLQWRNLGDSGAGWELIGALRSWDRGVRGVAAALLAKTEHARLLVRDLRRTRSGLYRIATEYAAKDSRQLPSKAVTMNTPYGLDISENCVSCKLRKGALVLRSFVGSLAVFQYGEPSQYLSRQCHSVRRRTNAERRLCAVFRQGEAFDNFPRR